MKRFARLLPLVISLMLVGSAKMLMAYSALLLSMMEVEAEVWCQDIRMVDRDGGSVF